MRSGRRPGVFCESRVWFTTTAVGTLSVALVAMYPDQGSKPVSEVRRFVLEMSTVMSAVSRADGPVLRVGTTGGDHTDTWSGFRDTRDAYRDCDRDRSAPHGSPVRLVPDSPGLFEKGAFPANLFAFTAKWVCTEISPGASREGTPRMVFLTRPFDRDSRGDRTGVRRLPMPAWCGQWE